MFKKINLPAQPQTYNIRITNRYFILELCAASLANYISGKYNGPMTQDCDSLIDMADGVQYIHSMNLVHRDIKPENVLIYVKDEVLLKITDFGCSKQSRDGEFSMSSQISGTQNYFAPSAEIQVTSTNETNLNENGKGGAQSARPSS